MYYIAVLALVACAAASLEVPGKCPHVKPVENFDYDSFRKGVWYEVARTNHIAEKGGQCSYTEYTPSGDGFFLKSYGVYDGELRVIEGYAKAAPEAGRMIHSLPYGANGEITHNLLNVLATDNKNYAVVNHCSYDAEKDSHRNLVWVFSRSKELSPQGVKAVEETFNTYTFLKKDELLKIDFSELACQITESVENPGFCPEVKTDESFDAKVFGNGRWYEVARTPHVAEVGGQCSYAEYSPYGDGWHVANFDVANGKLRRIDGYAKPAAESGKMIHSLPYGANGKTTHSVLNVLATDNNNYAVVYHCNYNAEKKSHRNLVWVFSRTKTLSAKGTAAVENVFKTNTFLRREEFVKIDFSKEACQITAESVKVPGTCPQNVKTVQNFDFKSFGNGVWYELARTPHVAEKDGQCSYAEYSPFENGFRVKSYHVEGGELKEIEGYAKPASEPGKMIHSLPYGPNGEITHNVLNVLATNNKDYAIVYHCNYNAEDKSHRNLLWVFSRSKELSSEGVAAIEAVFQDNKFLRSEELFQVDFSEQACKITARDVKGSGFCPKVKTVENFDAKSFGNGKWYEVARTDHIAEKNGHCSYTEYTPSGDRWEVASYDVANGKVRVINGYAKAASEPGKMIHTLPYGADGELTHNVLNVLATDNKNYAVVYHCNFNAKEMSHRNLVWVFSRTKEMTPEMRTAVEAVFKAHPFLKMDDLMMVQFSEKACQITESTEIPGFCPQDFKTVDNFDAKTFGKGTWYEIARTPHIAEKGGQCSYAQYTPGQDGWHVANYDVENGKLRLIEGYAKAAPEAGKMIHSLPYGANHAITHNVLNVMATDNSNYAVVYHCNYNAQKKSHRNLVWVFSRSKYLSEEGQAAVEEVFKTNSFLRRDELAKVDFTEEACKITAESVEVPGACPQNVKTVQDFDVKSFGTGVWYEVARTPHIAEKGGRCSYAKYTPGPDGWHVANYDVENGKLRLIEGYAKAAPEAGKMIHSLPYGENGKITHNTLNVLATNNKDYAVVYHCNYNPQKNSHRNLVWVFSRSKEMSPESSKAVEAVYKDNTYLRREELTKVDMTQQACQINAASSVVPGFCPQVYTTKTFDINTFKSGVWYEIAKTPHKAEAGEQCGYAEYTPFGDGFKVRNSGVYNGEYRYIDGYAKAASEPGKMIHSLAYGENGEVTDSVLNVLATDNENYAILYHCNFNVKDKSHRNLMWVFSRTKSLSAEGRSALENVFKVNTFLRREELIDVDFSKEACQIKAPQPCAQVKTVEKFDVESFGHGTWYEVMRTNNKAEEGGQCSYAEYTPSEIGFVVKNYHVYDGQLKKIEGHARAAPGYGQMLHSLPYGENGKITENLLNVLATDNKNYAILTHCNYCRVKKAYENLVWVFSRKPEISKELSDALEATMKAYPSLANEKLMKVDFSDKACRNIKGE